MSYLILIVVFISVAGLALGLGLMLTRDRSLQQRLQETPPEEKTTIDKSDTGDSPWQASIVKVAGPIARLSAPKEGGSASYLRVRLMNAGLRQGYWPVVFFAGKTLLALIFPLIYIVLAALAGGFDFNARVPVALVALCALGYYLPNLILRSMIRQRQRELDEALPDAIDLIMVCVEAGLAIDAAIKRTCEELDLRSPALAEELSLVILELQVGASRESAMHNLSLRTGVEDVAAFVTILLQSEHFGTNVADSLRTLAETMRETRKMRAEEMAAKIPLKLLFPMIFFIFPALFVVLLGPAMIGVFRNLLPTLGAH